MLVSAILNRIKKLESKNSGGVNMKIFFHLPEEKELSLLSDKTDVIVFIGEDKLEE